MIEKAIDFVIENYCELTASGSKPTQQTMKKYTEMNESEK